MNLYTVFLLLKKDKIINGIPALYLCDDESPYLLEIIRSYGFFVMWLLIEMEIPPFLCTFTLKSDFVIDICQKGDLMPRPSRCRRIEQLPVFRSFSPDDINAAENVRMTVDEYEALRLLDNEGLTQEACAERMNISRTTVTAIYDNARKKIADVLVNGKRLLITGGCCEFEPIEITQALIEKGSNTMRIAVTYENGKVFQHFGRCGQFKLYDVEDGIITNEQILDSNGSGHGALLWK